MPDRPKFIAQVEAWARRSFRGDPSELHITDWIPSTRRVWFGLFEQVMGYSVVFRYRGASRSVYLPARFGPFYAAESVRLDLIRLAEDDGDRY